MKVKESQRTFLTEQKRTKTPFESKYLQAFGLNPDRKVNFQGISPELIAKRQKLEEMQKKLAEERLNFEKWTIEHEHRENEVLEKLKQFKEEEKMHQLFNKQAVEDIARTKLNIEQEVKLTIKLEKELAELNEKEQVYIEKIEGLRQMIEQYKPSAMFLEDVVLATKFYETPEALLNKYRTLMSTKAKWLTSLHNELRYDDPLSLKKKDLAMLKTTLIERNHTLRSLRETKNKKLQDKRFKQISFIKNIERVQEKRTELATITASINNICRFVINNPIQTARSKNLIQEVPSSYEEQLEIIKNRYLDLAEIVGDPEANKIKRTDSDNLKSNESSNHTSYVSNSTVSRLSSKSESGTEEAVK